MGDLLVLFQLLKTCLQTENNWHHTTAVMSVCHTACQSFNISTIWVFGIKIIFHVFLPPPTFKPLPLQIWGTAANLALPSGRQSKFTSSALLLKPRIRTGLSARTSSVSGLRVELLADVVDDLGYKFVEVVKLIHEEGVLLVGVCGDVLQLILGCPGDADGVSNHT